MQRAGQDFATRLPPFEISSIVAKTPGLASLNLLLGDGRELAGGLVGDLET